MRLARLGLIFAAIYFTFVGGAVYYELLLPIRILHHIVVTVLLSLWLVAKLRGEGIPQTPLNAPLLLGVVAWFASAWFSIDRRVAFENVWFLIQHLIIFLILIDIFQHGRGKWLMEAQFIIGVMIVLISVIELTSWYFGWPIGGENVVWADVAMLPLTLPPRLAWAMHSTNWLAGYVAPLILVTGGWATTMRRPDFRRVLWVLAALLLLVLIFTFTRGGYLSFAAGLGSFTLMRLVQMGNLRKRLTPVLAVGLVAVTLVITITMIVIIAVSRGRSSGDSGRIDLYQSAIEMTVDNPVLGVGPGVFGRAFRSYRTPKLARDRMSAAHNAYLGTAAEGGLVTLALSVWIGVLLVRTWWQNWHAETSPSRRLRLEIVIAALLGIGAHSMVDIFQRTPNVILIALLVAYSITGHRSILDVRPRGPRWPAAAGLLILLAYGIWFIQLDRAQSHYENSLDVDEGTLEEAQAAAEIDPALNLYDLQVAYLQAEQASNDNLDTAINAYRHALELEPTWGTGWLNLAALYERSGDMQAAYEAAERAYQINPLTESTIATARLAEETGALDEDTIIERYVQGIQQMLGLSVLPLSDFWMETEQRWQAVERYLEKLNTRDDIRYRVWIAHGEVERAYALVPDEPQSAAQYWVAGEYAITVEDDPRQADVLFTEAIQRDRNNGDYYASRARARLHFDREAAQHNLDFATLLGTRFEYPNAIRSQITDDPEMVADLLRRALPGRGRSYAFSGVLYERRFSNFELLPEVRFPGPGAAALQPWYALAERYREAGRMDDARSVYEAILDVAPEEEVAREQLTDE